MKQPIVSVFGGSFNVDDQKKLTETTTPYFFPNDQQLDKVMREKLPQVIATVGPNQADFKQVMKLSRRERLKWLHFDSPQELLKKIDSLYFCFVNHAIKFHQDPDLVTIFSSSYNSGEYIKRPFKSLLNQTYQHWEWVIVDDSDGDENWANLVKLKQMDPRIRVYRADKNSGVIGQVKNLASSLARGSLLMEVDHDDELTPRAIEYLVQASRDYPEAGFFHSDFVEIHEDGKNFSYGDMFGLGYGSYRKEWNEERKKWINVVNTIPINPATIRYLVACPNHFRAWRTSVFREIGGWNHNFHVADDYEMMARSFLHTKFVKIRENCYYQYRNSGGNNHTFIRNREIQKLWRNISRYYNLQFNQRLIQLGKEDPYVSNWENYRQWQRCWLNEDYEEHLCETMKSRGRNPRQPLVAVAIVCYEPESLEVAKAAMELALRQSYPELQITAVGNCISEFEEMMDGVIDVWDKGIPVKTTEVNEDGTTREEEKMVKIVDVERAKRDLRWWNTNQISYFRGCLNYIVKASSEGDLVCYFDTGDLSKVEEFYKRDFIQRAVDMLVADTDLQMVVLRGTKHLVHRRSLFKKYGYWGINKDLFEIWKEKEKFQEI